MKIRVMSTVVILSVAVCSSLAADWPQYLGPDRNSISRNCTDWKPLAGASFSRKARKSCGVMVSRTWIWSIRTRSTACTRRNR